jgi:hypothetical protein
MLELLICVTILFLISTAGWFFRSRDLYRLRRLSGCGWEVSMVEYETVDAFGDEVTKYKLMLKASDENVYRTIYTATKRQNLLDTWSKYNVPIPELTNDSTGCPPTGNWQDDAATETLV